MKSKRRRVLEVPPRIKSFIDTVRSAPLENIQHPLAHFVWDFDKGDLHHWLDLFSLFDSFFKQHILPRNDLQIEGNFLAPDPPFPKHPLLHILRVTRVILHNCTNKHFLTTSYQVNLISPFFILSSLFFLLTTFSFSLQQHLSFLLASTDADVVESALHTLFSFFKKTTPKTFTTTDSSFHSKLFAFSQGWGPTEEGLGLIACSSPSPSPSPTLHFQFYDHLTHSFQIIHLPTIHAPQQTHLSLLNQLVTDYRVPPTLRFSLLTRLRFATAFASLASRHQYTCIRLFAFILLVQATHDAQYLTAFFNNDPDFINELVALLTYEHTVPQKIRILSVLALVALCQDRSRQSAVLSAATSGGHRGILPTLMHTTINSINQHHSRWSVVFVESLLSLVTVLVSSSSGCSALREAGLIPTLLPLLKDNDPQHLHLVGTAVHVLEAFMDCSNPAAALFRDLGGLDDTIVRLKIEVSYIEQGSTKKGDDSQGSKKGKQVVCDNFSDPDDMHPHYSDALVSYHRRVLMKALLRAISLGTYAPGSTARLYGSAETLLPHCLSIIFKRAKDFGGGVFSLAATVMSDLIHKDPTCFPVLDAADLPSAFLEAITGGVLCSSEAVMCIPQCLDALCLNNKGLQAVKDCNALRSFVRIFTSRTYLRALTGDAPGSLSTGLDELMRHASSLRGPGVDVLIEICNTIAKIGHGVEAPSVATDSRSCLVPVPMETDAEVKILLSSDARETVKMENEEQTIETPPSGSLANVESFLPECLRNVAHLLEAVLHNADTCRTFIEKKGIESVLQLFDLPLLPHTVPLGQSLAFAFKNFSPQHYTSLANAVCTFLREQLKRVNDILVSIRGTKLAELGSEKQMEALRVLPCLEGLLSIFLLKGSMGMVSELATTNADLLRDLGSTYMEVLWQISLASDFKEEEKRGDQEEGAINSSSSVITGNEEDAEIIPVVRYPNPASTRNNPHSQWGAPEDFYSMFRSVRAGAVGHRPYWHGLTRMRGARTGRHVEALSTDSEGSANGLDNFSVQDARDKSLNVIITEKLSSLASVIRSFFVTVVKGFNGTNRRRVDYGSLSSSSKGLATGLSKIFHDALSFSGYSSSSALEMSLSVKCRYLGKVVDDMAVLTFDSRRCSCNKILVNSFYVHGTLKELLTTFEATSQLLWTLPSSVSSSGIEQQMTGKGNKLSHSSWLLDTLQSYCRMLEYFVNSNLLLSPTSSSQSQQLVQQPAAGLSIGLFLVPRDPEMFIHMLQSQVLDVILPVWNHPMFPSCSPSFIISVVSLVTHIYSGVVDVKRRRSGTTISTSQRLVDTPLDETTIATIVEMGFTRARAEEALRRVETNSVEMAMEWLFSHAEDPVREDNELARALALSLGNSSETSKEDTADKAKDVMTKEAGREAPPIDDILASTMKLFQNSDSMAFSLTDLLLTVCNCQDEDNCPRVASYLIQQLKLCPSDFSKDPSALCTISHILALLLSEEGSTREVAVDNGIVSAAIDILSNFKVKNDLREVAVVPKCVTALLLILDNLLQSKPRVSPDSTKGISSMSVSNPSEASLQQLNPESKCANLNEKAVENAFEKVLGKSTGYLSLEECYTVLEVACGLMKQHVSALTMQAVLQLCARLTKTHAIAMQFLECGGLTALFSLPKSCFFPGFDCIASAIVRHLLEDPQTLQTAMELEIRQTLTGILSRHSSRLSPRAFLTSMAPLISRDPMIFMRAAAAVCQVESSGGRLCIVLLKDKEKDKPKVVTVEVGTTSNECVWIPENKQHGPPGKSSKAHKRVPANLTQVIDQLLEILISYPSRNDPEECNISSSPMEVDEPSTKIKGKLKVDISEKMGGDNLSERSAGLTRVTFVLKLMTDILLMYGHAVGVILRRDLEICQHHGYSHLDGVGHGGLLYHILHRLLPLSVGKDVDVADEWTKKLSEKSSWFLVFLSGRSTEGRKRVVNEIVRTLSSFSSLESNSSKNVLLPNAKILAFADLLNAILSKNSSSSSLPGPGCSPETAKTMIDGGMIQSLTNILQVIDLDHPNAPKIVNLILKVLESLTRAANASESTHKPDGSNKRSDAIVGAEAQTISSSDNEPLDNNQNRSTQNEGADTVQFEQLQRTSHSEEDTDANEDQSLQQSMGIELEETPASNSPTENRVEFMHEMEEDGVIHNTDGVEVTFRVERRTDDDMGDDDDDTREDGEDDDDDEDEGIAEDGAALMSLADTDVEDHDDNGLGDDYNDEMADEGDDFHENRVIEVRWSEGLDGLDQLQVVGRPGAANGLVDVGAEPFQGVNMDDIFGVRRPLVGDRRRQTGDRALLERSALDGGGFQHPLLLRPSRSGDQGVSGWSTAENTSRDLESLPAGSFDVTHFYMFDAPALPSEHAPPSLFDDHLVGSAPPPLIDFSLGMDSLHLAGRRGLGDGRWTDDGQPQAGAQAAIIAQAVEEEFISQLRGSSPTGNANVQRLSENLEPQEKPQSSVPLLVDDIDNQQMDVSNQDFGITQTCHLENLDVETDVHVPDSWSEDVNLEAVSRDADDGLEMQGVVTTGHANEFSNIINESGNMDMIEINGAINERLNVYPDAQDQCHSPILNPRRTAFHDTCSGEPSIVNGQFTSHAPLDCDPEVPDVGDDHASPVCVNADVDMDGANTERNQAERSFPVLNDSASERSAQHHIIGTPDPNEGDQTSNNIEGPSANTIDPTFLDALPEDLRAEVLASQQTQSVEAASYAPPSAEDIDPEFLAALPPDIQAEVLAQQRTQRVVQSQQAEGQAVEMDNASIIATFPADLREEVLLTSSEAVLSALPSPLLAEAQMLRDRAMSHYQARSLFGSSDRLSGRRNNVGFDRQNVMDRGVGVTIGRTAISSFSDSSKLKEIEGTPLMDENALKALIRLLRLAQPLGKGLLQRLLLNLCAHSVTRAVLLRILLDMIKPEADSLARVSATSRPQRLYGCQSNVVYGRSQLMDGLPPLMSRRILEILTYLATNHSSVASMLFYFDLSLSSMPPNSTKLETKKKKGKEKLPEQMASLSPSETLDEDMPIVLFLKLLNQPLFLRSSAHLEQIMGLLQVAVYTGVSKLDCQLLSSHAATNAQNLHVAEELGDIQQSPSTAEAESSQELFKNIHGVISAPVEIRTGNMYAVLLKIPGQNLRNLCSLLAHEGLSDKVYLLAAGVLKKLASIASPHRKFFTSELADLAHGLSSSAVDELVMLKSTDMLGLSASSMTGAAILRVLQVLGSLIPVTDSNKVQENDGEEELTIMWNLNFRLEPLWYELSNCISMAETKLGQSSSSDMSARDHVGSASSLFPPLPPGTQRLLPFIEGFFVLCEKVPANHSVVPQDHAHVTAREVKESCGNSMELPVKFGVSVQRLPDVSVTFARFAEKHRRLLNAFLRQNPGLLEKSLSMMLKAPRLVDFDNKRAYFRSRIRQQHELHPSAPLRISVRRPYVLEDSYNQLRMRSTPDLKGRLTVQFQGEEGIDAGGLTREWYQLLSRVIFDKGALLFTTVGSNATFQPNPNSVYQTEHLSYFKFVGRVVAKALFDSQLLDVYFTRSFYKHILGAKVTYHDIGAVDPDYYKNLKWMLENDVSDVPDLTFSMDADEEKHILYEKTEVTDYELITGGRNTRVTEETKHEYVDLVAEHILTNAIRPQINSFLEGFNELVPRELISIFNDKELELLISGLPEIDMDDLKANTEYTGYTAASNVVQWFWEIVKAFSKEDMARFLQFVTGTSKVPLEGFRALQGISGPQRFQIHKAYGAPVRLPSAHTCFNQLDLPEYTCKEQLQERLLLAIHEASEGFGFG